MRGCAHARAQRDGRQRQGDAPATPTPRRQGQQHGRRHLRAGPGQPPPGMRADRQVRVMPGNGPPPATRPLPGETLPQQQRQQGQRAGGTRRDAPACRHGNPYPPRAATCGGRGQCQRRAEASARCPAREPSRPGKPCARDQPRPPARPPRPASRPKPRPAARAPARLPARARGQQPLAPPRRQRHRHGTHHVASRPSSAKARCPQRQLRIAPMTRVRQVVDDLVLMRAGRSLSTTMRVAMNSASSTSCVTSSEVKPARCPSPPARTAWRCGSANPACPGARPGSGCAGH